MALEDLVKERNAIHSSMNDMAENPNNSYGARKNLGAILNSDYPIDVPNPNEYLNKESVLNEYLAQSIKKREDAIKQDVEENIKKYISEVKEESLAGLAINLDPEYQKIIKAGKEGKFQEVIRKYAINPDLCLDLISTAYNPQEAMKRVYTTILDIRRIEIEKENRLYEIVDNTKVLDRENIERYLMKNVNASNKEMKGAAYLAIAEEYCAGKN